MAFKLVKITGNGTAQAVVTNGISVEAVVHSMIAYNTTGGALSFDVLVDGVSVMTEEVGANSVFRMTDKLNLEPSAIVTLNAATGVNVTVNYLQQAIDTTAALTQVQQAVVDAQDQVTLAEAAAALATTNGSAQVTLAADQVTLAEAEVALAQQAVIDADIAASSANNKGSWSALTGALAIPASVNHDDNIWVLNVNIADITLSEPSVSNTDYTIAGSGSGSGGVNDFVGGASDTVYSVADIDLESGGSI